MLQDFRSVSDHFGTLCIKGLSNTESELQKSIAYKKAFICEKWAWKHINEPHEVASESLLNGTLLNHHHRRIKNPDKPLRRSLLQKYLTAKGR